MTTEPRESGSHEPIRNTPIQVWLPALIFTSILIIFLMSVFFFAKNMSSDQRNLYLLLFALLAGFSTFFLGGTALLELTGRTTQGVKLGFSATAGVAIFVLCYIYPPYFSRTPVPPIDGGIAKETQPKETQPKETQPKETQPKETQPKETQPKETQPKETFASLITPTVTPHAKYVRQMNKGKHEYALWITSEPSENMNKIQWIEFHNQGLPGGKITGSDQSKNFEATYFGHGVLTTRVDNDVVNHDVGMVIRFKDNSEGRKTFDMWKVGNFK